MKNSNLSLPPHRKVSSSRFQMGMSPFWTPPYSETNMVDALMRMLHALLFKATSNMLHGYKYDTWDILNPCLYWQAELWFSFKITFHLGLHQHQFQYQHLVIVTVPISTCRDWVRLVSSCIWWIYHYYTTVLNSHHNNKKLPLLECLHFSRLSIKVPNADAAVVAYAEHLLLVRRPAQRCHVIGVAVALRHEPSARLWTRDKSSVSSVELWYMT